MIITFNRSGKTFEINTAHIIEVTRDEENKHTEIVMVNDNNYHFRDTEAVFIWEKWTKQIVPALGGYAT